MLTIDKRVSGWAFALMLLALVGCQSSATFYRGYQADTANVAPLAQVAEQQGRWETFDLDLNYRYRYADRMLDISGAIDLGLYHEINTRLIRSLNVYLFFVDDQARVLETAWLVRSARFRPEESLSFAKSLKVPAGTAALAFGYDGEAREDGGDGRGDRGGGGGGLHIFSNLPKRGR
jgi:hypothetical protein